MALVDEWGNDQSDRGLLKGAASRFFAYRSTMKVGVFGLALMGSLPWPHFFAFLVFDLSYALIDWYSQPYILSRELGLPHSLGFSRMFDRLLAPVRAH